MGPVGEADIRERGAGNRKEPTRGGGVPGASRNVLVKSGFCGTRYILNGDVPVWTGA